MPNNNRPLPLPASCSGGEGSSLVPSQLDSAPPLPQVAHTLVPPLPSCSSRSLTLVFTITLLALAPSWCPSFLVLLLRAHHLPIPYFMRDTTVNTKKDGAVAGGWWKEGVTSEARGGGNMMIITTTTRQYNKKEVTRVAHQQQHQRCLHASPPPLFFCPPLRAPQGFSHHDFVFEAGWVMKNMSPSRPSLLW